MCVKHLTNTVPAHASMLGKAGHYSFRAPLYAAVHCLWTPSQFFYAYYISRLCIVNRICHIKMWSLLDGHSVLSLSFGKLKSHKTSWRMLDKLVGPVNETVRCSRGSRPPFNILTPMWVLKGCIYRGTPFLLSFYTIIQRWYMCNWGADPDSHLFYTP